MLIKFRKLSGRGVMPIKAHSTDAGFDLTAAYIEYNDDYDYFAYHTDIAVEIPNGYVGLVFPRSSNRKTNVYLTNHVGVIDSGYRGDIIVTFKSRDRSDSHTPYDVGDRIAQLIILPYPDVQFIEMEELSDSDRGTDGHGASGK